MSVTWIDPPGSTLAGKDDAIDFSVTAPEPPAPITTFWSVLYDKDVRTLVTQSVAPAAEYTYKRFTTSDGIPWAFQGSPGTAMISNGAGLTMSSSARQLTEAQNAYAGCRVCVICNELPGYDATKELCAMVRFEGAFDAAGSEFGSVCWTGSQAYSGPAANSAVIKICREANLIGVKWTNPQNAGWDDMRVFSRAAPLGALATPWVAATIFSVDRTHTQGLFREHAGTGMPAVEQLKAAGGHTETRGRVDPVHMGFYVGAGSFIATHVRILQRVP